MTDTATPADRRLELLAEQARDEAARILALLPAVVDAQWSKGRPAPAAVADDAGIRSKNEVADPTGDIVVDLPRLRVRAAAKAADGQLLQAVARLRHTRGEMERALSFWEGV